MIPQESGGLYVGTVQHRRFRLQVHRLSYRVAYLLVDLEALPRVGLRLLSLDRANVFSLRSADYGAGAAATLRERIVNTLKENGFSAGGRIRLLTIPRLFGHAFNPVSVYFCDDADGAPEAIVYEVHNTFGERHSYVIAVGRERPIVQEADKVFHVSPFLPMAMRYRFIVEPPAETLRLAIHDFEGDALTLAASMSLARRPLSDAALLRLALTMPLMAAKVLFAIHWEALKLWVKGARVFSWSAAPAHAVSTGRPVSSGDPV